MLVFASVRLDFNSSLLIKTFGNAYKFTVTPYLNCATPLHRCASCQGFTGNRKGQSLPGKYNITYGLPYYSIFVFLSGGRELALRDCLV